MSIAITQGLGEVVQSANKSIFIVSGSLTSGSNYRYVADVKNDSGTTIARLKCDKVPTNDRGFFDVSKYIKTLVAPPKPSLSAGWQNPLVAAEYEVVFMEEYGSPPVVATGVTTTASGIVIPGYTRQYKDFVASGVYTSGDVAQPLTNRTNTKTVRIDQHDFISVLLNQNAGLVAMRADITYPNRVFTVSGGVSNLSQMFNGGPAGLAAITSGQTSDGLPGAAEFAGYSALDRYAAWTAACDAAGASGDASAGCVTPLFQAFYEDISECGFTYSIEYIAQGAGDTFYRAKGASVDSFTYTINCCERFVDQLVYFRNALGGIDCFNFTLKNRKTGSVNKQTFGKNSDVYGSTTFESVYFADFTETWTLLSDYLVAADSEWLSELVYSPEVYLLIDGELIEAVVDTNAYQFFQKPQDDLVQLQIDVRIAYKTEVI